MVGPLQYPDKPRGNWRSSPNFLKNTPRCVPLFCSQGGGGGPLKPKLWCNKKLAPFFFKTGGVIPKTHGAHFFAQLCKTKFVTKNKTVKTIFPPQEHYFFHRTPVLIPKGTPGQTQGEPFLRYMVGPLQYPAKPRGNWKSSPNFFQNGPSWGSDFCLKNDQKYWYLQCFMTEVGLKPLF